MGAQFRQMVMLQIEDMDHQSFRFENKRMAFAFVCDYANGQSQEI